MKAWTLYEAKKLVFEERSLPALSPAEVRVRVMASGICGSDIARIYETGAHRMPLIPGHEFSGVVEAVGGEVSGRWLGKRVGVYPLIPCKECDSCRRMRPQQCRNYGYLGSRQDGGYAEYVSVPAENLIELPKDVSYEAAAMLEPAAVAWHAIRHAVSNRKEPVLVIGLGTIGLLAVMLLRDMGVERVYALANKAFQVKKARELGAEEWRAQEEPAVVMECVGKEETVREAIRLAAPDGTVVLVGNPASDMVLPQELYWEILRKELTLVGTWNSAFLKDRNDDWDGVISRLTGIQPERLITHRLPLTNLDQGLKIMREKTEPYTKIMIFPGETVE